MAPGQSKSSTTASDNFGFRRRATVLLLALLAACPAIYQSNPTSADEGGVSFWVPGIIGSLAAVPPEPGFAFANIFYHAPPTGGATLATE